MNKKNTQYVCLNCSKKIFKWMGRCPNCLSWNSFEDVESFEESAEDDRRGGGNRPQQIESISYSSIRRIESGVPEFDRVLGGGIVPGSLVLVGGDPGVGKSTLLTTVLGALENNAEISPLLYVSGEESSSQVAERFKRLVPEGKDFWILNETNLENIFSQIDHISPRIIVIDSIQTTASKECSGGAGSASQVKEVTYELMNKMKSKDMTCFIIGHVTKDGQIAGPKLLEHMVDTVVYFEGEGLGDHRVLRTVKNRYGNAREVGLFLMNEKGLTGVINPMECFAGIDRGEVAGRAPCSIVEGSRVLLVEIQSLVLENKFNQGRRVCQGVDSTRVSLLLAIMEKHMGIPFRLNDIYLNIVGGLKVDDRSADLAIMTALWSSLYQIKIDASTSFIGEVGLNGEVRPGNQIEQRLKESERAGLSRIFVADEVTKKFQKNTNMKLIGIKNVSNLEKKLFDR